MILKMKLRDLQISRVNIMRKKDGTREGERMDRRMKQEGS